MIKFKVVDVLNKFVTYFNLLKINIVQNWTFLVSRIYVFFRKCLIKKLKKELSKQRQMLISQERKVTELSDELRIKGNFQHENILVL